MNRIRWLFMSKYDKLIYAIKVCQKNGQRLHINEAAIILDFETNTINDEVIYV